MNPGELPIFVYGLLRPGDALWDRLEPAARGPITRVQAPGTLHASPWGSPVLIADNGGLVTGDLVICDPTAAAAVLVTEELAYGYDLRWLPVNGDGIEQLAVVCTWPHPTFGWPVVDSGEWPGGRRFDLGSPPDADPAFAAPVPFAQNGTVR